jgi:hypothetical protein
MNNIKGFAIANDGSMKRIAITYDVIDENGKPIKVNAKTNNFITDGQVLSAIAIVEAYAQGIVDNIENEVM